MNPIRKIPLHVLMLAGLLAVPKVAAEEKPAAPEAKAAAPAAPEVKMQAYAGINVSTYGTYQRARDPLAEVPEGIGLVVGFLDPEGPAVGKLQERDVLTRLDDQVLVNAEQFRALLQTRKPGDKVKLVRARGDDVDTVEITLTGKPMPVARPVTARTRAATPDQTDPLAGAPIAGGIRIMVNGQEVDPGQMIQGGTLRLGPNGQGSVVVIDPKSAQMPAEVRRALEDMRQRGLPVPPDLSEEDAASSPPAITSSGSRVVISRSFSFGSGGPSSTSSSMYSDDEGTVSLRKEGDKKHATVKSADGKVLFDGEITTEEQLKAVPADVRPRIALADGSRITLPGVAGQEEAKPTDAADADRKLGTSPKPAPKKKPKRDPHEGA